MKKPRALIVYGTTFGATKGTSEEIAKILREKKFHIKMVIALQMVLRPMREVAIKLEREGIPLIQDRVRVYLHDIYENVVQINESIENYRDKIPVMIEIYYASVSHKINEIIIKVLTIVATIFLPLSLLVAVFGISLPSSPIISIPVIVMVFIAIVLFLRRKDWI